MSSLYLLLLLILPLMAPSLSSASQPDSGIPTIPASPSFLPNGPLSPFQELSPDIAPLLPSPGGKVPPPSASDIPTIPASPSPPNPDDAAAPGPDYALSPFGSLPVSSADPKNAFGLLKLVALVAGWAAAAAHGAMPLL